MAVITQDTFDPLKAWISVRLQQGVPIVDADWNEADDARRFELRAYLKWFVGDGIPEGNDGFRISQAAAPATGNFLIHTNAAIPGGTTALDAALRFAGRAIVDGLDVMITADTAFNAQPLHPSVAGSAALAAAWGVSVIDTGPLTTNGITSVAVYLDVWERLVTPTEAPSMILPALGIESCARRKREWVVRVANTTPPAPLAGHSHYVLAVITRPAGAPVNIVDAMIADRREKRLLTPPSTIITDAFGGTVADYRRGLGRPIVSLRTAISASVRGEIPSTPVGPVTPVAGSVVELYPRAVLDRSGGVVVAWSVQASNNRVALSRLDLLNPAAVFSAPVSFGPAANDADSPWPVVLPSGDIVVTFAQRPGAATSYDVYFRRATTVANLAAAADQVLFNTAAQNDDQPVAVLANNFVVFLASVGTNNALQYRRYQHTPAAMIDGAGQVIVATGVISHHAASDPSGNVWGAYATSAGINVYRLNPVTNTLDNTSSFAAPGAGQFTEPFVQIVGSEVWVLWSSVEGIRLARHAGTWQSLGLVPESAAGDVSVRSIVLSDGNVLVAFSRPALVGGAWGQYGFVVNATTFEWSRRLSIFSGFLAAGYFSGVPAPDGSILALWSGYSVTFGGEIHNYFKRLALPL